jgi:hypothetical protein
MGAYMLRAIVFFSLISSPIPPWKLWTMPKHDLAREHGVPK